MSEDELVLKATNRSFPGFTLEKEGKWKGTFSFIQATDTQLGLIERYIEKKSDPGWEKEMKLTKDAIEAVNAISPRPSFFVICGDLIDAYPGSELRSSQEKDFISLFRELHPDIPLVCVCGNHDVGETPTVESVKQYTEKFGEDYFSFYCGGVKFIVINSQYFEDSRLVPELAAQHEDWLNSELEEAKSNKYKHVVMFQHIPWFITNYNEEKCYFNLSPELRQKWLPKFLDANIKNIFCGHWHGNSGGVYKDLEIIVSSAIGAQLRGEKSGLRIVTVEENRIKHKYYNLEDIPKNLGT